jgi:hypothetical protein
MGRRIALQKRALWNGAGYGALHYIPCVGLHIVI